MRVLIWLNIIIAGLVIITSIYAHDYRTVTAAISAFCGWSMAALHYDDDERYRY